MSVRVGFVVVATVLVALSGLAGGTRPPPAPASSVPDAGSGAGGLPVTDAVPVPAGFDFQLLPAQDSVSLTFTLAARDPAGFAARVAGVSDPSSPLYHHYLSYAQVVQEYGPAPATVAAVESALRAAGASVTTVTPDGFGILARASPASVRALLGVSLVQYGAVAGVPLYTATGSLTLPADLAGLVSGIGGLSDAAGVHLPGQSVFNLRPGAAGPASTGLFLHDNTSGNDFFVGSDYTQAYRATALFPGNGTPNATYPTKVAIATLLASGYNQSGGGNLPPWDPNVVYSYFNTTFPSAWPKPRVEGVPVPIGTDVPPLPGSFGALNDSTLDEFENSLDLEMAGSLAPGASIYNFYFGGDILAQSTPVSTIASDFATSLADALAYNYSPAHLAVVSGSFGLPDLLCSLWDTELGEAALLGVTVVIASGDQGNAPDSETNYSDGQWPTWPGSAAFNDSGAVAVGGVSVALDGSPSSSFNESQSTVNLSYDPTITGIAEQSAWYSAYPGEAISGTEGGDSTVYAEPSWQFRSAAQPAIVNATIRQGASTIGRAEPDVAMPGNSTLATTFANATGTIFLTALEGTSIAAPVLAGLLADVVGVATAQNGSHWSPLGLLDPTLYRIASYYQANPNASGDPFLDIVDGHNYVFSAGPGWSATTGWGSLVAPLLLAALKDPTIAAYNYTGPSPGLPPPSPSSSPSVPWNEIYIIFGVGLVVAIVIVVVASRPSRPRGPTGIPLGAHGGEGPGGPRGSAPPGSYPGASFLCPYCGAVRPAEPVRCPQCGAY